MLQSAYTLKIRNSFAMRAQLMISPPVHGPSLQRTCLPDVSRLKLNMSCCRVIFVVVNVTTLPWLASVVMNFKRGHEGAS